MDEYLDILKTALLANQGQEVEITRGDEIIYAGLAVVCKVNYTANYSNIKVCYNDVELIVPAEDYKVGDNVAIGNKTYVVKPYWSDGSGGKTIVYKCDGENNMVKIRLGETNA